MLRVFFFLSFTFPLENEYSLANASGMFVSSSVMNSGFAGSSSAAGLVNEEVIRGPLVPDEACVIKCVHMTDKTG